MQQEREKSYFLYRRAAWGAFVLKVKREVKRRKQQSIFLCNPKVSVCWVVFWLAVQEIEREFRWLGGNVELRSALEFQQIT